MIIGAVSKFVEQLAGAGLIPDKCRRVVIDIPCEGVIKMYYEIVADGEKLGNVVIDEIIAKELKSAIANCPKCGGTLIEVTTIASDQREFLCANPNCKPNAPKLPRDEKVVELLESIKDLGRRLSAVDQWPVQRKQIRGIIDKASEALDIFK